MTEPPEKTDQQTLSEDALQLKQDSEDTQEYLRHQDATADEGAIGRPNPDAPVDGALTKEGQRPVLERSRKVR